MVGLISTKQEIEEDAQIMIFPAAKSKVLNFTV